MNIHGTEVFMSRENTLNGFITMDTCHYVCVLNCFSCPTLCDPMDYSPPGSSVHGILQVEYWGGLSCSSPGDLPDPGIKPMSLQSPALAAGSFSTSTTWEAHMSLHFCLNT